MATLKFKVALLGCLLFNFEIVFSQLEKVVVEKYYVSDVNDATDTIGGNLPIGSVTYRVFVDLAPGTVLKNIYGDVNHPFKISSSEIFFNHRTEGKTFSKDFVKARYSENTVALDSWLTLGQISKKQGSKAFFGVLKYNDDDGSFVGGINNDGGSSFIPTGLLTNSDPICGIPLTTADGIDTMTNTPNNWNSTGVLDFVTGDDSTAFGSLVPKKEFLSSDFILSNSGIVGVEADTNQILIAQLTTLGDLSFEINLEVEVLLNGVSTTLKYVAKDTLLQNGEIFNPYLTYPLTCGCNDPDFLEYNAINTCYLDGSCVTPVKFGCMDSTACNYDPVVNINVEDLCCFPGKCNNRDISIVCPELRENSFDFNIHPNPYSENLYLDVYSGVLAPIKYTIYNTFGTIVKSNILGSSYKIINEVIGDSDLENGVYQIKVEVGDLVSTKLFIKN
jgi:hypothetical protein